MRYGRVQQGDRVINVTVEKGIPFAEGSRLEGEYRWLPPVRPGKIIGLALNYKEHAEELSLETQKEPVIFLKPDNSLTGHLEKIIYPPGATFVHYEGELAAVMGRRCRNVSSGEALGFVEGYTIANDVTARDYITNMFRPPVKAKGFDTFCPLGPCVVTLDEVGERALELETRVNGSIKQKGRTDMMIHSVPSIIEFLSSFMTLYPGDVILTGTPRGIEPVKPGDRIDIEIKGIGTLTNIVAAG